MTFFTGLRFRRWLSCFVAVQHFVFVAWVPCAQATFYQMNVRVSEDDLDINFEKRPQTFKTPSSWNHARDFHVYRKGGSLEISYCPKDEE